MRQYFSATCPSFHGKQDEKHVSEKRIAQTASAHVPIGIRWVVGLQERKAIYCLCQGFAAAVDMSNNWTR
jgi:hypothetical protein